MYELELREAGLGDVIRFYDHEADPEALRRANFAGRDRATFVAHWQRTILGDLTVRARAVLVDGQLAGNIVAWWHEQRRYVGYWLAREFWGRGVGTAALRRFLAEELERPLYADTDVANTASVRLLERCGFRPKQVDGEGRTRLRVLDAGPVGVPPRGLDCAHDR